jgi:hypothetical protein
MGIHEGKGEEEYRYRTAAVDVIGCSSQGQG